MNRHDPTVEESLSIIAMLARDEALAERILKERPEIVEQAMRDVTQAIQAEPKH